MPALPEVSVSLSVPLLLLHLYLAELSSLLMEEGAHALLL